MIDFFSVQRGGCFCKTCGKRINGLSDLGAIFVNDVNRVQTEAFCKQHAQHGGGGSSVVSAEFNPLASFTVTDPTDTDGILVPSNPTMNGIGAVTLKYDDGTTAIMSVGTTDPNFINRLATQFIRLYGKPTEVYQSNSDKVIKTKIDPVTGDTKYYVLATPEVVSDNNGTITVLNQGDPEEIEVDLQAVPVFIRSVSEGFNAPIEILNIDTNNPAPDVDKTYLKIERIKMQSANCYGSYNLDTDTIDYDPNGKFNSSSAPLMVDENLKVLLACSIPYVGPIEPDPTGNPGDMRYPVYSRTKLTVGEVGGAGTQSFDLNSPLAYIPVAGKQVEKVELYDVRNPQLSNLDDWVKFKAEYLVTYTDGSTFIYYDDDALPCKVDFPGQGESADTQVSFVSWIQEGSAIRNYSAVQVAPGRNIWIIKGDCKYKVVFNSKAGTSVKEEATYEGSIQLVITLKDIAEARVEQPARIDNHAMWVPGVVGGYASEDDTQTLYKIGRIAPIGHTGNNTGDTYIPSFKTFLLPVIDAIIAGTEYFNPDGTSEGVGAVVRDRDFDPDLPSEVHQFEILLPDPTFDPADPNADYNTAELTRYMVNVEVNTSESGKFLTLTCNSPTTSGSTTVNRKYFTTTMKHLDNEGGKRDAIVVTGLLARFDAGPSNSEREVVIRDDLGQDTSIDLENNYPGNSVTIGGMNYTIDPRPATYEYKTRPDGTKYIKVKSNTSVVEICTVEHAPDIHATELSNDTTEIDLVEAKVKSAHVKGDYHGIAMNDVWLEYNDEYTFRDTTNPLSYDSVEIKNVSATTIDGTRPSGGIDVVGVLPDGSETPIPVARVGATFVTDTRIQANALMPNAILRTKADGSKYLEITGKAQVNLTETDSQHTPKQRTVELFGPVLNYDLDAFDVDHIDVHRARYPEETTVYPDDYFHAVQPGQSYDNHLKITMPLTVTGYDHLNNQVFQFVTDPVDLITREHVKKLEFVQWDPSRSDNPKLDWTGANIKLSGYAEYRVYLGTSSDGSVDEYEWFTNAVSEINVELPIGPWKKINIGPEGGITSEYNTPWNFYASKSSSHYYSEGSQYVISSVSTPTTYAGVNAKVTDGYNREYKGYEPESVRSIGIDPKFRLRMHYPEIVQQTDTYATVRCTAEIEMFGLKLDKDSEGNPFYVETNIPASSSDNLKELIKAMDYLTTTDNLPIFAYGGIANVTWDGEHAVTPHQLTAIGANSYVDTLVNQESPWSQNSWYSRFVSEATKYGERQSVNPVYFSASLDQSLVPIIPYHDESGNGNIWNQTKQQYTNDMAADAVLDAVDSPNDNYSLGNLGLSWFQSYYPYISDAKYLFKHGVGRTAGGIYPVEAMINQDPRYRKIAPSVVNPLTFLFQVDPDWNNTFDIANAVDAITFNEDYDKGVSYLFSSNATDWFGSTGAVYSQDTHRPGFNMFMTPYITRKWGIAKNTTPDSGDYFPNVITQAIPTLTFVHVPVDHEKAFVPGYVQTLRDIAGGDVRTMRANMQKFCKDPMTDEACRGAFQLYEIVKLSNDFNPVMQYMNYRIPYTINCYTGPKDGDWTSWYGWGNDTSHPDNGCLIARCACQGGDFEPQYEAGCYDTSMPWVWNSSPLKITDSQFVDMVREKMAGKYALLAIHIRGAYGSHHDDDPSRGWGWSGPTLDSYGASVIGIDIITLPTIQ